MKVFISADMEGISGVVAPDDVSPGKGGYAAACKAMTGDVNAAVAGALEAGAEEVVVFDAHAGGRNVDLELLDRRAEIIRGQPCPAMIAGLDETFSAVFLIGYHARIGTAEAVMDHTFSTRYFRVKINGRPFGEVGLAAAYAGSLGVPVALVSGDDKLAREAADFVPRAVAVVVKTGMGRHGARCLAPAEAQERIRQAARGALSDLAGLKPLALRTPLVLEVEFPIATSADRAACLPTVERSGDRSVTCTLPAMSDVTKLLSVLSYLTA